MKNYVNYSYYKINYEGNLIPQKEFDKYAKRASGIIRNAIYNRDTTYFEDSVNDATCSVAEILFNQYLNKEKLKNIVSGTEKVITSEKVGDYSRNIANVSVTDLQNMSSDDYVNDLISKTLEDYLLATGLLYCGGF